MNSSLFHTVLGHLGIAWCRAPYLLVKPIGRADQRKDKCPYH